MLAISILLICIAFCFFIISTILAAIDLSKIQDKEMGEIYSQRVGLSLYFLSSFSQFKHQRTAKILNSSAVILGVVAFLIKADHFSLISKIFCVAVILVCIGFILHIFQEKSIEAKKQKMKGMNQVQTKPNTRPFFEFWKRHWNVFPPLIICGIIIFFALGDINTELSIRKNGITTTAKIVWLIPK